MKSAQYMISDSITLHNLQFELYKDAAHIEEAIRELADRINNDYSECNSVPLLVITLSGGFMFASELSKYLDFPCEFAFVKCSSYYDGMSSSCQIRFDVELTTPAAGREVIVLEDIIDTGNTYIALRQYLFEKGASSVKIASLLFKKEVYDKQAPIDYIALESENSFLVGYGLDYNQLGRNLNGLYKLKQQ